MTAKITVDLPADQVSFLTFIWNNSDNHNSDNRQLLELQTIESISDYPEKIYYTGIVYRGFSYRL